MNITLLKYWLSDIWFRRALVILGILGLIMFLLSPMMLDAYAGLGGYISEKSLGSGTSASFQLGATGESETVLGTIPIASTGGVTDTSFPADGVTTATLHGTISDLNGMPSATYYFKWGYQADNLFATTPTSTTTTTGDKTITITDFSPAQTVYYQFYAGTDGTTFGTIGHFIIHDGRAPALFLLWNLLTLAIAVIIFIVVLKMSNNPIAALIGAIIGIIAIVIVHGVLESMF